MVHMLGGVSSEAKAYWRYVEAEPRSDNNADEPLFPQLPMNGIVLAGGLSTRMGQDKASLPWRGSDLLHAVLYRLAPICRKIIVVSNMERKILLPNVIVVPDHYLLCGPLGGMQAGLVASDAEYNFIAACDMPYLNTAAAAYIRRAAEGHDAAVPHVDGYYNPLHGVYRRTCLPHINRLLAEKRYRILEFFNEIDMRHITAAELSVFDAQLKTLSNVNTPQEYEKYSVEE